MANRSWREFGNKPLLDAESLAHKEAELYMDVYAASIRRDGVRLAAKFAAGAAVEDFRAFLHEQGYVRNGD